MDSGGSHSSSSSPRTARHATRQRTALVLSGGGSRGAYEAGVLSWLFEHIYPKLGEDFEFDVVSGTSVGAIHAAYVACSSGMKPAARANNLIDTWKGMRFEDVMRLSWLDFVGIPMRGLGFGPTREHAEGDAMETRGGIVDVTPLENLVRARVPWHRLRANLAARRPSVLCTVVTAVDNGIVRIFLDGPGADVTPWVFDPHVDAEVTTITDLHVRASAAIPFLFPAVRIGDRYYVDGGVRLNTPLSPALRLGAEKIVLVGLGKRLDKKGWPEYGDPDALTKPAFLFGKILNVMLLDPIENELRHVDVVNAMLEGGKTIFGDDFVERLAPALQGVRGTGFRHVDYFLQAPSDDIGRIAADSYYATRGEDDLLASMIKRTAMSGVPREEADFLSYIYFDHAFTDRLVELGREDAKASTDRFLELLTGDPVAQER